MSNITWNFDNPTNYDYDSDKIKVTNGLAKLKSTLSNVYAYYKLEENTGQTVLDSSGNNRNGTPINNPTSVSGKLNNCLSFDGNNYITLGNTSNFERTDSFSIECWIKTVSGDVEFIITNQESSGDNKGWALVLEYGKIRFQLIGSSTNGNGILVKTNASNFNDNNWHHVVVTYNGTSSSNGIKIYVDNTLQSTNVLLNSLSQSIVSSIDTQISGRDGNSLTYNGLIDNIVIYDKVLTLTDISNRYNNGDGTEEFEGFEGIDYPTDKPTIETSSLENPFGNVSWESFILTASDDNQGTFGVNLYKDDKNFKYYWNGQSWVSGGDSSHYNSSSVVNDNISDFIADDIGFVLYLISDGTQKVEVDNIQITYSSEQPPNVNAGTNKSCKDNQYKKPFSDALISDPDGNINSATAKAKIGDSDWIDINKGGYFTLQEAIREWQYKFDSIGDITCQLKIIDDQSKESIDSMIMSVSKYTVTFVVKDSNGNHLPNIEVAYDDGTGWHTVNSPWTYDLEYKSAGWAVTIDKFGFSTKTITVTSTEHTENITMDRISVDPQEISNAVWNASEAQNLINSLERVRGLNQENYKLFDVTYNNDGNLISGKIRIYKNKSDCNNDTNHISEYIINDVYNGNGTLQSYKVVRE